MARVWTDEDLLECLDLIERQGLSFAATADRMSVKVGHMKGIMSRLRKAIRDHDPDGHLDGTMPPRWWERKP